MSKLSKEEVVDALREKGLSVELKDHIPFLMSYDASDRSRFIDALSELGYTSSYGYAMECAEETDGVIHICDCLA